MAEYFVTGCRRCLNHFVKFSVTSWKNHNGSVVFIPLQSLVLVLILQVRITTIFTLEHFVLFAIPVPENLASILRVYFSCQNFEIITTIFTLEWELLFARLGPENFPDFQEFPRISRFFIEFCAWARAIPPFRHSAWSRRSSVPPFWSRAIVREASRQVSPVMNPVRQVFLRSGFTYI